MYVYKTDFSIAQTTVQPSSMIVHIFSPEQKKTHTQKIYYKTRNNNNIIGLEPQTPRSKGQQSPSSVRTWYFSSILFILYAAARRTSMYEYSYIPACCCVVCWYTVVAAAAAAWCCLVLLFVIVWRMAKSVTGVHRIWFRCFFSSFKHVCFWMYPLAVLLSHFQRRFLHQLRLV